MTLGIFLCCLAFPILAKKGRLVFVTVVLTVGGIYGVIDEVHQAWVPGRMSDPMDVVLDVVGLGLGLIVFFGALRLKQSFSELRRCSTER
jgi:VanZ family protein